MDALASKTLDVVTPVSLKGKMGRDGYIPENDAFYDALTEPRRDGRPEHPNPACNRVGRDPMTVSLDLLTASGHPPRRTSQVMSAYRSGMGYTLDEAPTARTHKELRAICYECRENSAEIRRCAIINCPIWPYRMGKNPHNPRRGKNPFA